MPQDRLERGTIVPDMERTLLQSGNRPSIHSFLDSRLMLVFLGPRCGACRKLVPHLNSFAHDYEDEVTVVGVCTGASISECEAMLRDDGIAFHLLADEDRMLANACRVQVTPNAVLCDDQGRVLVQGIPNNLRHLEWLLREEATPIETNLWMQVAQPDGSSM